MIGVLAALLVFGEPLRFAAEALTVLPTISYRGGWASIELIAHALIAALSAAAGFSLWNGSPDGPRLARLAILAAAARAVQSMYWSVLPNDTPPGSELLSAGISVIVAALAFLVLQLKFRRAT